MNQTKQQYDLADRTTQFSIEVVSLCRQLFSDSINRIIVEQLVKSSTSIGANYREANAASSKKDFTNKIFICKKELSETEYWLKIVASTDQSFEPEVNRLREECHQLTLIFQKIATITRDRMKVESLKLK